ncbi:hypothetical protein OG894_04400 [Streptomyces sp. NBC_01724]|uniref:hypothetical protein n=1 Tax=unclassified Streptomyces TaxID=2593676 RepID=UPI002DD89EC3|nr:MULTISPECIES: hypothetical protein [unclassified Streptomyces]WSC73754.1 hypothetical protein OG807_37780 [Streptomyces sp. NBC_01760]WTE56064.1 hypothetical protein OG987_38315 [Streptomyces sp. NBC_01620]WTE64139.1 hypothetical protein OG784_38060 [Streptomyces sp. NBC_01617]WTI91426.1 hypothetical protein OHB17_37395 [Streptomyces sp. NBC_00724]
MAAPLGEVPHATAKLLERHLAQYPPNRIADWQVLDSGPSAAPETPVLGKWRALRRRTIRCTGAVAEA